jgi:hypothetical protein
MKASEIDLRNVNFLKKERNHEIWVIERNRFLEEYQTSGFSTIPIKVDKTPLIKWSEYQKRKPEAEEIYNWCIEYPDMNIGIVTGAISNIVVFDYDYKVSFTVLPSFFRKTTITETKRGFHFWFMSSKGIQFQRLFDGTEIKGNGSYIVAPPSIVLTQDRTTYKYVFLNGLDSLQILPDDYINKYLNVNVKKIDQTIVKPSFKFEDNNYGCIKQILNRELVEGERELSFFIVYNLLIKKNRPEYSESMIRKKNSFLKTPLNDKELENVFHKPYNQLGCSYIRATLSYIDCTGCKYLIKEAKGLQDWRYFSQNKELSADMRTFALLMRKGYAEDRNIINEINKTSLANELGLDRKTVIEAIKKFKRIKKSK